MAFKIKNNFFYLIIIFNLANADVYKIISNNRLYKLPKKNNVIYAIETNKDIYEKLGFKYLGNNCVIYNKHFLLCKYIKNYDYYVIVNEINVNNYMINNKYIIHYIFEKKQQENLTFKNNYNENNYHDSKTKKIKIYNTPKYIEKDNSNNNILDKNNEIHSYILNDNFKVSNKISEAKIESIPDVSELEEVNINEIPQPVKEKEYSLKLKNKNYKKINSKINENTTENKSQNIIPNIFQFEKIFDISYLKNIYNTVNYNKILDEVKEKERFMYNKLISTFDLNYEIIDKNYTTKMNIYAKNKIIPIFNFDYLNFLHELEFNKKIYLNKISKIFNFVKSANYQKYFKKEKEHLLKIKTIFNINYDSLIHKYFIFYKIKKVFNIKKVKVFDIKRIKKYKQNNTANKGNDKLFEILNQNFEIKPKRNIKNKEENQNKDKLINIIKENF